MALDLVAAAAFMFSPRGGQPLFSFDFRAAFALAAALASIFGAGAALWAGFAGACLAGFGASLAFEAVFFEVAALAAGFFAAGLCFAVFFVVLLATRVIPNRMRPSQAAHLFLL
jgi:hypothetical protein